MAKKMSELKTEELTEILKQTTDIDVFLDDNELLPYVSLAEYINELVEEKKTKIADVARRAHMSSSYLYKLGEGKRKSPTRNKALQICFGLGLDIDESNELLKLAGVGVLYSKIARDSIIMFCLEKKHSILKCEELLEKYKELSAVKNGKVILAPYWTKPFGNPDSDSVALGELWMAHQFYPDKISADYVEKRAQEFYKNFYGTDFTGSVE